VRNRIQTAAGEISDEVLNEFIAEQTSRRSSNRMPGKCSLNPIHNSDSLARSAPIDRCAAKALVCLSAPSAGISYTIDELKVDKADPANANLSFAGKIAVDARGRAAGATQPCNAAAAPSFDGLTAESEKPEVTT
jgi:hypothetical protein